MQCFVMSIDPGTKCLGWAVHERETRTLRAMGLLELPNAIDVRATVRMLRQLHPPDEIWIEKPQVYTQSKLKGDPNDLIDVALTAGAAGTAFTCPLRFIWPADWKGQVKKELSNKRTMEELVKQPASAALWRGVQSTVPKALRHNVLDACGIGAWACRQEPSFWPAV